MQQNDSTWSGVSGTPPGFLILHRGAARLNVYELKAGERLTIGRSPANTIVVPDAKCSRQHCEVFLHDGDWILRDLGSKNGLSVDSHRVQGDWPLEFGQRIEIGQCTLLYSPTDESRSETETVPEPVEGTSFVIVDRKAGTQFDQGHTVANRHVAAKPFLDLIQLGRAMNEATDINELTERVLEGLLQGTPATLASALLSPRSSTAPTVDELELIGVLPEAPDQQEPYSRYLSEVVLSDKVALLVHDVQGHESLSQRKSLQALSATSAICAPIRYEGRVLGVLHLYASELQNPFLSDHLEFALAVADQMGTVLFSLFRHEAVVHQLEATTSELRELLELDTELIGDSDALQRVKRSVARVAPTDATVLIRGESGVGKELVARAVHINSDRKGGPFVCVNCAALTESLLESELFGHEKGAFTGASAQKPGKFEQANNGTLFLDEVGEMSPEIQAKFLRVLEGQPFERVGGGKAITVDVRVVTATNRNLENAVRDGTFRQDLFYRLQVIEINVPPLRKHPEDIASLAKHFLDRFVRKTGSRVQGFNRAAIEMLLAHPWPGNVRELKNVVERAVILTDRNVLTPDDIQLSRLQPVDPDQPTASQVAKEGVVAASNPANEETTLGTEALWRSFIERDLTLDDIDRMYMEAVLQRFNWNKSQTSRLLGIERTTLDRRLKKYGLARPQR